MNLIDIAKQEEPINPSAFSVIDDNQYPVCLLGVQIRNSYDQLRCTIKKENNPVDLVHFIHYPDHQPLFFRGIQLEGNSNFDRLVEKIRKNQSGAFDEMTPERYKQLITGVNKNLTCDRCYSTLRPGVYPIDSECVEHITTSKVDIHQLYGDIFQNECVPYFQAISYFTVFILDSFNSANGSNAKSLKKIIEVYKTTHGKI